MRESKRNREEWESKRLGCCCWREREETKVTNALSTHTPAPDYRHTHTRVKKRAREKERKSVCVVNVRACVAVCGVACVSGGGRCGGGGTGSLDHLTTVSFFLNRRRSRRSHWTTRIKSTVLVFRLLFRWLQYLR